MSSKLKAFAVAPIAEREVQDLPAYSKRLSSSISEYLDLSIFAEYVAPHSMTFIMQGEYRSPDFTVLTPNAETLFTVQTDSTFTLHEMNVHDPNIPRKLFTVKRKGHGDEDEWFYSSSEPKTDGKKLFEVSTTPSPVSKGGSMRLVFRNGRDGELDALNLRVDSKGNTMQVMYRGRQVGSIRRNTKAGDLELLLTVPRGMDPLLTVVMALVVDDRLMTKRRRVRRPLGSGWKGIGKGPGAGLAGAYALGGAI